MNKEIKELIDLVEAWIARKDADALIELKHNYNKTRPFKHGKEY